MAASKEGLCKAADEDVLARGMSIAGACRFRGINTSTLFRWRKREQRKAYRMMRQLRADEEASYENMCRPGFFGKILRWLFGLDKTEW